MNKTIPSQFVHEVGEMVEGCVILEKPVVIPLVPIRCLQVLLGQFARPTQCVPVSHYLSDNPRSEEHTSELQSHVNLVCRLLLEKKKTKMQTLSTLDQKTLRYQTH